MPRNSATVSSRRYFEIFEPLDFIAEVTQHIPDHGARTVRYYGWDSNKVRGTSAKAAEQAKVPGGI